MLGASRLRVESRWRGLLSSFQRSSHLADTLEKEFSLETCSAVLSAFLFAIGSTPHASSLRPLPWRSRAIANDTSGYFPNAITFSLLSKRYFHRHSLPPPSH